MDKQYLGDSVYAERQDHGILLTTENGLGPSNSIFLEPEVLSALNDFSRLDAQTIEGRLAQVHPEELG